MSNGAQSSADHVERRAPHSTERRLQLTLNDAPRDGKCHCYDLRFDPLHAEMVLGGEAPLWGEHIDSTNLLPRAFPRASAVAERLWSSMHVNNASKALPRLIRQRCRMLSRGIPVTPLGPGHC